MNCLASKFNRNMSLNDYIHNRGYDEVPVKPIDRLEPLRKDENKRRKSFEKFPKNAQVDIEELLADGFFYIGDGENDRVQCAFCGGILKHWNKGDNVNAEHRRIFDRCPRAKDKFQFLNHGESHMANFSNYNKNVMDGGPSRLPEHGLSEHDVEPDLAPQPQAETGPRHPNYSLKTARLNTYRSWPSSMKQKPNELAEAGLFYTGEADKTLCYQCGGALVDWEPEDIPAPEHDHWFPDCTLAINRGKSNN